MIRYFPLFASASLLLSACSHAYLPDAYTYPTGYVHHDTTPISSPHGYDKSIADETAYKTGIVTNAIEWHDGLAAILTPITGALDMNTPVAVVMDPGITPLNASAANYLRDLLIDMGYLTALANETGQVITVSAKPGEVAGTIHTTLAVRRNNTELTRHAGVMTMTKQAAEVDRLPGFTRHPATGPVPDTRPWHNLNQN